MNSLSATVFLTVLTSLFSSYTFLFYFRCSCFAPTTLLCVLLAFSFVSILNYLCPLPHLPFSLSIQPRDALELLACSFLSAETRFGFYHPSLVFVVCILTFATSLLQAYLPSILRSLLRSFVKRRREMHEGRRSVNESKKRADEVLNDSTRLARAE